MIALTIPATVAYMMIWSIGIVWIDRHVGLDTSLGAVPAAWFNSVDSFVSILAAAPLIALWAAQARRRSEPASLTKIAIGSAIIGASALLLVAGSVTAGADGKVSVLWALAGYSGMGVAFLWYWPVTLALVSQAAPAKINSTMVSGVFMALFLGSTTMGWIASFYDQMTPTAFWTVDAAIGFVGALLVLLVRRPLSRALATPTD